MGRRAKLNAKKRNRRIIVIAAIAVIVIAGVAFALLISSTFSTKYGSYIYQPVPSSLYQQISTVSDSTLSAVGQSSGVSAPTSISGSALTLDGKPEILYIGAEYCPYCAVERWALIVALTRFGNFTGLEYMLSSSTDINANTPTFTFSNAVYSSDYVSFVPVEEYNRTNEGTAWHTLTDPEDALFTDYGTGGFPFIDFANSYVINGVQTTIDLGGDNWTQVASQLNNPSSTVALAIDGSANRIISTICKIDGGVPTSVCTQSYATLPLAFYPGPGGTSTLMVSSSPSADALREYARWTI